jgi:predicted P-loop ATPase/GTPase
VGLVRISGFFQTLKILITEGSAAISNPNKSNEVKTRKYEPHKTEGLELSAFHKQECISFFTRGYSHEMTIRYG